MENPMFPLFPLKRLCGHIRPCNKVGQGQPYIMIYTNCDEPGSLMLHTALFKLVHPSREGNFKGLFFTIHICIWARQTSWSCDLCHLYNILDLFLGILHIKFGFDWSCGF